MKKVELPKKIPVFPLSNFIIFPKTTVPLNIFEPRYIDMVNESMKSNKLIGMIQPRNLNNDQSIPKLHDVGCLGKIVSFKETEVKARLSTAELFFSQIFCTIVQSRQERSRRSQGLWKAASNCNRFRTGCF